MWAFNLIHRSNLISTVRLDEPQGSLKKAREGHFPHFCRLKWKTMLREKVSIFLKEKKICSTQIEGKDSSKEGTKIEMKTTTFIASPYSTVFAAVGTIFKADFLAWFLRFFWHGFQGPYNPCSLSVQSVQFVCTVAQKSRQKQEKIWVWFFLFSMENEAEIFSSGLR